MNLKSDFERDRNFVDFVVKISIDLIFSKKEILSSDEICGFSHDKGNDNVSILKQLLLFTPTRGYTH